jgi:hypothetical protein
LIKIKEMRKEFQANIKTKLEGNNEKDTQNNMQIDNHREFLKSSIIKAANETLGYKHKANKRVD